MHDIMIVIDLYSNYNSISWDGMECDSWSEDKFQEFKNLSTISKPSNTIIPVNPHLHANI